MIEDVVEDQNTLEERSIEITVGDDAFKLISENNFQNQWDKVYQLCPWATVFQSKAFVVTWYNIYKSKYLPIIVKATIGDEIAGLLFLAQSKKSIITGAGANRAEYQCWLTSEADGVWFIKKALYNIRKSFPGKDILLRFIPVRAPLAWVQEDLVWVRHCFLKAFNHPLWILETDKISKSLRKQSNKINRLKRLGELQLQIINDPVLFRSIIDEVIEQFDFRKGAMYNITPFRDDPLRKELLLSLFDQDFLHVSIFKLDEKIIACKVATKAENCIILQGMSCHSPSFANYSPGILHFLYLAKLLSEHGCAVFDLTPGEDAYKQELATINHLAYELVIPGKVRSFVTAFFIKKYFDNIVKNKKYIYSLLSAVGISHRNLDDKLRNLRIAQECFFSGRNINIRTTASNLLAFRKARSANKIFQIHNVCDGLPSTLIQKDSLKDLIAYEYMGSKLLRGEFLTRSMEKFQDGAHVYTLTENSCLMICIWVKEQVSEFEMEGWRKKIVFPKGSTVLFDIYCRPKGLPRLKNFLKNVTSIISVANQNDMFVIANNIALVTTFQEFAFKEYKVEI